jgi:hypothetical protein
MTMCSICGIVSVPAGSCGYGSDPGCRNREYRPERDADALAGLHAPVPATAPAAKPAFSSPRLLGPPGLPSRLALMMTLLCPAGWGVKSSLADRRDQ